MNIICLTQYRYDILVPDPHKIYLIMNTNENKYFYYKDMFHAWLHSNDYTKYRA